MTPVRRLVAAGLLGALGVLASAGAAAADPKGSIELSTRQDDQLHVVFQADGLDPGVTVDLDSVTISIGGVRLDDRKVDRVQTGDESVRRTVVLAIDNSKSMAKDEKFESARTAAIAFLDALPPGVKVGLVTFADVVGQTFAPNADHAEVRAAIDGLTTSTVTGTALYDGAVAAVNEVGAADVRRVVLITDGNEFGAGGTVAVEDAIDTALATDTVINAVYIGDPAATPVGLGTLVSGTDGTVQSSDPTGLSTLFAGFGQAIDKQIDITADVPSGTADSAQVIVAATAGGGRINLSDSSVVAETRPKPPPEVAGPVPVKSDASRLHASSSLPYLLGALFVGLVVLAYLALAAAKKDERHGRVRRRLSLYTLTGRPPPPSRETRTALGSSQVARSAVELAGRVVDRRDFEATLALRLEAAGMPLRAAEWMLIHVGIAVGSAIVLLLVSGGGLLPTLLGLVAGLVVPWVYLLVKESRRTSAFLAQLPDTLQLLAGSLSAGYSVPQAMDTVVREGQQPITGEFNRALVEARLGVAMEEALEGVAERMKSKDFAWVVMAIRIQREVGGNLAELLSTVSGTLREREALRRQVKVLSAEGRLSAWILGLLPPAFALYLALARPSYLKPLISEPMGLLLLSFGLVLLAVGGLWMRKAVRVEV